MHEQLRGIKPYSWRKKFGPGKFMHTNVILKDSRYLKNDDSLQVQVT